MVKTGLQSTSRKLRVCMTLLVCLLTTAFMALEASASVDALNQWPATPYIVSNSANGTVSAKFTPSAGASRMMIVAIATEYSAAQTPAFSMVSYGGQNVTQIAANTTNNMKIWIGYLMESGIASGSAGNKTLLVTNTVTTNLTAMYVTAAVYGGVSQVAPTGNTGTSASTLAALATAAYNVSGLAGNNGLSVYVAAWNGQTSTAGGTPAHTEIRDYAGTSFNLATGYAQVTNSTGTSSPATTPAGTAAGVIAGVGLAPQTLIATNSSCSDCHGYPPNDSSARNVPPGQFVGSHDKHSGKQDQLNQYGDACTDCHYNAVGYNHQTGFKNITGSRLPGNAYIPGKKIAMTNTDANGTCSNTTCHSTGRSNIQYATTPAWNAAPGTITCLSCHAGRAGTGNGPQANSSQGFKLSSSHSQHLKYTATEINCNMCHGSVVSFDGTNLTLKNYSGVIYHANGTANVVFRDIAYGTYTAFKTGSKTCQNVACHGGKSRGGWQNASINTNNTCVHCHGVAVTSAALANTEANRKFFAPGYGGGTSTDQLSVNTDNRVGAHFVHLSSVYSKRTKCNECHRVPSQAFDGTHMTGPRFSSQSLTFDQASTAKKNSAPAAFTSGTATTPATCATTYCHGNNMPKGDTSGTARSVNWNDAARMTGTPGADCGACHGNPPLFGSSSTAHIGSVATTSCVGCHKTVANATGNIIDKSLHINGAVNMVVDTATSSACNKCHGNPPQGTVVKYGRYSGLVKPATLALGASPANMGAHAKHASNGLSCNTCHTNSTISHPDNKLQIFFRITSATITGWNTTAQRAPYGTYSGNSGGMALDTSSTLIRTTASTNNSCNTYCHGGWNNSNRNMNPRWTSGAAATTCGACHGTTAATPPLIASHARHAGYSSAQTARQGYSFNCVKCHPNRVSSNHIKGAVHVRFSTAVLGLNATYTKSGATSTFPAGVRLYTTKGLAGDTPDGTCSNINCHSTARGALMGTTQYATTPQWGTTTRNCLSCHGGRNGAGAPARSTSNFTLSTTHSQHLKYPAANINCQICHSKTVSANAAISHTTLKDYTGVQHHANGTREVIFTGINYASYTSYKTSGVDQNKCTNTACHGGKSRGTWSATVQNNDNSCVHCHGTAGTSAALSNTAANRKFFAPGWNRQGTSTDQTASSNDLRVGSHFKHLSSVYMKNIKCNECHTVPATAFDGTHMATPRYNSQTLSFGQASSAKWNGATLTTLATFAGYTVGTPTKAATCSSVYCHGSRLKKGDTAGTYRKPYWNYSAMINYTAPAATVCSRCHGYPPTSGTHSASTTCSTCHTNVSSADNKTIINKTLHINGIVEASSHTVPYPGATHATPAGTSPWSGCIGCHTNGSNTTYPVAAGTAPDCRGCHKLALSTTPSGTSACSDCHGASVTDGRPNGAAFPNWSGNHTRHVVNQGLSCNTCHGPYGGNIGDKRHGFSNHTAHTFALGFVNVTSTSAQFKWARVDGKTGTCSTNVCHSTSTWGNKFTCNSCHSYLATDSWNTTYGIEGIGAHVKHINYLITRNSVVGWSANDSYGSTNFNLVCGVCHSRSSSDHSMTKAVNSRNINFGDAAGRTARQFGTNTPIYNGNAALGGTSSSVAPKSCSNIDCHYRTSPVWSTY